MRRSPSLNRSGTPKQPKIIGAGREGRNAAGRLDLLDFCLPPLKSGKLPPTPLSGPRRRTGQPTSFPAYPEPPPKSPRRAMASAACMAFPAPPSETPRRLPRGKGRSRRRRRRQSDLAIRGWRGKHGGAQLGEVGGPSMAASCLRRVGPYRRRRASFSPPPRFSGSRSGTAGDVNQI